MRHTTTEAIKSGGATEGSLTSQAAENKNFFKAGIITEQQYKEKKRKIFEKLKENKQKKNANSSTNKNEALLQDKNDEVSISLTNENSIPSTFSNNSMDILPDTTPKLKKKNSQQTNVNDGIRSKVKLSTKTDKLIGQANMSKKRQHKKRRKKLFRKQRRKEIMSVPLVKSESSKSRKGDQSMKSMSITPETMKRQKKLNTNQLVPQKSTKLHHVGGHNSGNRCLDSTQKRKRRQDQTLTDSLFAASKRVREEELHARQNISILNEGMPAAHRFGSFARDYLLILVLSFLYQT